MKWLLKLYPREFQRRYRQEMEAQLTPDLPKMRTALDLIAGAVDAWLNQDLVSQQPSTIGNHHMIISSRIDALKDIKTADAKKFTYLSMTITILLVIIGIVMDKTLGDSAFSKALIFSSWPISIAVTIRPTLLKPYSAEAKNLITIFAFAPAFLVFFFTLILLQS